MALCGRHWKFKLGHQKVYGCGRGDGTDENGFLSKSMMIKAMKIVVLEKIWINRVAG